MIEKLSLKKNELLWLLDFIGEHNNYDFYYTQDNNRIYITDLRSLKKLLRNSLYVYVKKEKGDILGVILAWKSIGGGVTRFYVKILANSSKTAKDLLTVLLWNSDRDLFVKIRKDSKFLNVFKEKGFRFCGARGIQILLNRKSIPFARVFKQEDEN